MHTVQIDNRGFLTVLRSTFGVNSGPTLDDHVLCHYDFDRTPANAYPDAHVQISGSSPALEELNDTTAQTMQLGDLHFPVGGRRYRPSLADVVEFLIVEGLARGRHGWPEAIDTYLNKYREIQLRAAIRRSPHIARDELTKMNG